MTEEERKTITQAVQTAKKRIAEAAIASGRKPEDITLVAATKMNDAERVRAAIAAAWMSAAKTACRSCWKSMSSMRMTASRCILLARCRPIK